MKDNKGITLTTVIMTVILLTMIAGIAVSQGIDSFHESKVIKFETYMRMIQKKVDIMVAEGSDYTVIGSELTDEQKNRLQHVIDSDAEIDDSIETDDVNALSLRYFSEADIESAFDIQDVEDEIVINFENREVISLNGIEKEDGMYYLER